MTTDDTLHPRAGDPPTSQHGINRTIPLRSRVLVAAFQLVWFNDTELTQQVNRDHHVADRNVVARTRLSLEKQGYIVRMARHEDQTQLTFRVVT
jgi:hypothetical protein